MRKAKLQNKEARYFAILLIFCFFLAGKTFAQDNLEILAEQINRGNSEQKRNALFQIRNLETAEASRLGVSALQDKDEVVRASAAASVVFLPSDEAVQVLLPLLRDKKPFVRKETAYALGKTRNAAAIRPLLAIIQKDKIQEIKDAATVALGEIGNVSAVDSLIQILKRQPKEKEEFMRRSAARSIGQIAQIIQTGDVQIFAPRSDLEATYKVAGNKKFQNLTESYPSFRQAIPVLIQILQSTRESDDVKRESAFALGEIGDDSALSILQLSSNAQDYYLAEICKEAIEKIESK